MTSAPTRLETIRWIQPARLRSVPLDDLAAVVILARRPAVEPEWTADSTLPAIVRVAVDRLGLPLPGQLRRTATGRPYLVHPNGQRWSVDFNLSHSGDLVGVAVGVAGELGLDLQRLPDRGWARIGQRWLHPEEWARIADAPSDQGVREFTRAWAIREARCKATGRGMAGFRSPNAITPTTSGELDGVWWRELPVPAGYAAALAWAGPPGRQWASRPVVVGWENGSTG